ncbi:hypothetical protein PTSG_10334 [Salpingoeca rosetta]|uniref:Uncharacterized protein n=1 Tax=Salpingoeca rosetta (strain ATCC 50818 / BSB-021) TaxID=946362 RepID=F2UR03_SALR5|nr:uncharacterized protein PTSG_10334 [Salpingoeca rosetta]EGD80058.1 hypothetical protein PTSG_10334 [Salpingoeca rosetta]|eukprot:XP_004988383.1 hypothetical protein PTSG_10334 [Salpingoeca rosetta]
MSGSSRRVQSARSNFNDLAIDCTPPSPSERQRDLLNQYATGGRPQPQPQQLQQQHHQQSSIPSQVRGTIDVGAALSFMSDSSTATSYEPTIRPKSERRIPSARSRQDRFRAPEMHLMYTRTDEERLADPDRINLDNRSLDRCPYIRNEPSLRLLNLQHNSITAIANLDHLENLIFLDMYDNRIQRISGLERLRSLRVLMLGRNSISSLAGIEALVHLDVLDLHGNAITTTAGIAHLRSLRVLNLASNLIKDMSPLAGLASLVELNISRNQIQHCIDLVHSAPHLQRLFLSDNLLRSTKGIVGHGAIAELSLDGNAEVTGAQMYREQAVTALPSLRLLDNKRVSDEERRMAGINVRKMEDKKAQEEEVRRRAVERDAAIEHAQEKWREYTRSIRWVR